MRIAIGNDHAAVALKVKMKKLLVERRMDCIDFGAAEGEKAEYPIIAEKICEAVTSGKCDRGILLCGTGVGMAIAANKVKGIRAAVCSDVFSARMTVEHNDSNVLCMGGRVVGEGLAADILNAWLDAKFEGERHCARVDMIKDIETRNFK